jgi:DNA repair protein RadC
MAVTRLIKTRRAEEAEPLQEKQQKPIPAKKKKDPREAHRERLRDRLQRAGPKSLADHELLELVLFRAIPRRDVKEIARELITHFGDISAVMSAPPDELVKFDNITPRVVHEFLTIQAAALRLGQSKILKGDLLASWDDLVIYCRTKMAENEVEEFHVLFLDKQNRIIADEMMGRGTVDHTPVYSREVLKRALALNATALIIAHNHPSGDPSPSKADIEMTYKLRDLAQSFNIALHDHLIIARGEVLSFKSQGLL